MNQAQYLEGLQAFVPDAKDNPDCIPFYRAWRGMENVLGKDTMSHWHHLMHEAICWATYKPIEEQYATILQHLRSMVDRWKQPEPPRYFYFYECAPSEPTEQDARKFFNEEYKKAFPGKRVNSKHANELWLQKKEQALSILRTNYKTRLAAFEQRKQDHEAREQRARQDWINQFHSMALFEQFVRGLEAS